MEQPRSALYFLAGTPVLLVTLLVVFLFYCITPTMADPDIWWHLRNAETIIQTHRIISQDSYSFTALHAPWIDHEWLPELVFYAGWRTAGATGVALVTHLAVLCTFAGVVVLAYRESHSLTTAILVTLPGILLSTVSFGPRTLLFGWICLVIELLILQNFRRSTRIIWWLPLLFAVWVNSHGSWSIGLVLLLVFLAAGLPKGRWGAIYSNGYTRGQLKSLVGAAACSFLALFVNPYGWRLVAYPLNMAFHQRLNVASMEEWRPLDFQSPRGIVLLAVLGFMALWQLRKPRRWSMVELVFLAIGIYSGVHYLRFLFLLAIVGTPVLAKGYPRHSGPQRVPRRLLLRIATFATLLCLSVVRTRELIHRNDAAMDAYPTAALPALKAMHLQGNILNDFLWGGYMIWNLRDDPTFIDSRVDIFEYNGTLKDYLDIVSLNRTLELLEKHNIRYVLFERNSPLIYFLSHTAGWRTIYQDSETVLLERQAFAI